MGKINNADTLANNCLIFLIFLHFCCKHILIFQFKCDSQAITLFLTRWSSTQTWHNIDLECKITSRWLGKHLGYHGYNSYDTDLYVTKQKNVTELLQILYQCPRDFEGYE